MQEKKTPFVGQIVAQFDLVSTTSRLRASQNLLVPSLLRTQSQRKGLWEGRKNLPGGYVDGIAGRIMR